MVFSSYKVRFNQKLETRIKPWFSERLKEDRLKRKSFTTVEELEKYSEMTTGTLWLLSLASLGVKDVNADTAAKHAARCIGENCLSEHL